MARPVKNLIQVLSTGHGAGRPSRARTVAATPSLGNSGRTALGGEARVSSILPRCTVLLSSGLGYTRRTDLLRNARPPMGTFL